MLYWYQITKQYHHLIIIIYLFTSFALFKYIRRLSWWCCSQFPVPCLLVMNKERKRIITHDFEMIWIVNLNYTQIYTLLSVTFKIIKELLTSLNRTFIIWIYCKHWNGNWFYKLCVVNEILILTLLFGRWKCLKLKRNF